MYAILNKFFDLFIIYSRTYYFMCKGVEKILPLFLIKLLLL